MDAARGGFRIVLAVVTHVAAMALPATTAAQPQAMSDRELDAVTAALTRARIEAVARGPARDAVAAGTSVQILDWGALEIVRMRGSAEGGTERAFRMTLHTDGAVLKAKIAADNAAERRVAARLAAVFVVRKATGRRAR